MSYPETQISLLARLTDSKDTAAWIEFCEIYEPATYRLACRFGLQDADAREVTQEVLLTVSRKIADFDVAKNGRFRGWLSKIARNAAIDSLRRRRIKAIGGSDFLQQMENLPGMTDEGSLFDFETRREQFRWAAGCVEKQVKPKHWQAFWLTAVEGLSGEEVAERLELSVGNVYVMRSRILNRIKKCLRPYREQD